MDTIKALLAFLWGAWFTVFFIGLWNHFAQFGYVALLPTLMVLAGASIIFVKKDLDN